MTLTRQIKAGTTDVSVVIRIVDDTDGTPETGVVWNTSGIDMQYRREGAASTAITEATLAALTTAHTDGGFLHIGNGYYRLDLPDAACASGASGVLVHGTVTGMVVIGCYIELVAYDPTDTVRLGLTALPDAAADAAGGLPISDAGGLDLDALNTNVSGTRTDTEDIQSRLPAALVGGRIDATVDGTGMESGAIDAIADGVWDEAKSGHVGAGSFGEEVQAHALSSEVSAVETDTQDIQSRLPAALVSGRMSSDMVALSGSTTAADNLEASALGIIVGAAATGTLSTTQMTTNLSGYDDDRLIGRVVVFTGSPLAGEVTDITDYASASGLVTFSAVTEAPTNGTTFVIV